MFFSRVMEAAVFDCLKIPPKTSNVRKVSALGFGALSDFCTDSEEVCFGGRAEEDVEEEEPQEAKIIELIRKKNSTLFLKNTAPLHSDSLQCSYRQIFEKVA